MTSVQDKTGPIRVWVVSIVLSIAFGLVSATLARRLAQDQKASGTIWEMAGRLPTDDEWRQMAKHYGGVREDSDDQGNAGVQSALVNRRRLGIQCCARWRPQFR